MHFEILVEDASGSVVVEAVVRRILARAEQAHTFRIHSYKGIGRLPHGLVGNTDPSKRILLDRLPMLLRGYGKSLSQAEAAVVVVVDADTRDCVRFKEELVAVVQACNPRPTTLIRIAVEELEAWLLGDPQAVKAAYPTAITRVLSAYRQDEPCGTWEVLADAVHPGGSVALKALGWPHIGQAKHEFAERIAGHLDLDRNVSPSLQVFRSGLVKLGAC